MQLLGTWSLTRVLLVCAGWIVLSVLVIAVWIFLQIFWTSDIGSGSAGIGAVSIGINELVLAIPLGPPMVLLAAWLVVRIRG